MAWLRRNFCVLLLFYSISGYSEEFSRFIADPGVFLPGSIFAQHHHEFEPGRVDSREKALKIRRGRDIWFNNTYGGEKFFDFLAYNPDPDRRLQVCFKDVINTPRDHRLQTWGTI